MPSKRGEQLFKVGRVTDATVAPGVGLLRPLDHRAAAQLRQAAIVCRRELLDSRAGGESVRQAGGQAGGQAGSLHAQRLAMQRAFQLPRLTPIMVCSLSVASSRGRRPQPPTAGSSANLELTTAPGEGAGAGAGASTHRGRSLESGGTAVAFVPAFVL